MSLSILSVAYPFAPVGSRAVGGAEQILTSLEAEVARLGYRSTVVAREGSTCAGRLFATHVPAGMITPEIRRAVTAAHQESIRRAFETGRIDLVHMHGIDFHEYRIPAPVRVLVTLHLPPGWYPESIWTLPDNYTLQCVSETQRLACPPEHRSRVVVVENGVPLPAAGSPKLRKRSFALLLSRICPEKNLHEGLDAARLAGVPALIAGETFPYEEHVRYMQKQIKPRLGHGTRWLGPVSGARKRRLLATARCVLLPTVAAETSSLAAMEALATGTPVVAYRSGAIPEIVEDGKTGFLVNNTNEMGEAIRHVQEISPAACRAAAQSRFSLQRMVADYCALYDRIMADARSRV
jgi:glycosyltransferase involved in cell wall biosynthesis